MPSWDGQKRRTSDNTPNIHDLVIRIDENVKTLKENHCQHLMDCTAHRDSYEERFCKIYEIREKDLNGINKRFIPLEQAYWKMTGILALLIILSRMIPLPWK